MPRKKKKKKLTKEEKARRRQERKFKTDINTIFTNACFTQIPTREVHFDFENRKIEIDNVYLYENIIVISEDTTRKTRDIRDHLNNKSQVFDHISNNKEQFIKSLKSNFSKFKENYKDKYVDDDIKLIFVYSSLNRFDEEYKKRHPKIIFMDYNTIQYFRMLSKTIHKSIRFELFKFLRLNLGDIGIYAAGKDKKDYDAFLLPESPSGFPTGYKLLSFLIEPNRLLEQVYVLRKDGWKDTDCLYQRLLIPTKIKKMREYLVKEKRVFVNNLIVTLPRETVLLDKKGKQIEPKNIKKKEEVIVQIPRELNTIGIVDGQHRIFAYHEGLDKFDKFIEPLREKQHLLLTGIIYPEYIKEHDKTKFEAQLFLEINDKQSRTKADLKQAIEVLVDPFSTIAISKKILNNLSLTGPLSGYLEEHFYDTKKIKTSSIVSYGLRHIIKLDGDDTFFKIWTNPDKDDLKKKNNRELLRLYIQYCTTKIRDFLAGFRKSISPDMWILDKKKSRVLTTTTINGLIFCLRKLIEENKLMSIEEYEKRLKKLKIKFTPQSFKYKSSHWKDLGEKIYSDCFE